jgi:hypothetical protein
MYAILNKSGKLFVQFYLNPKEYNHPTVHTHTLIMALFYLYIYVFFRDFPCQLRNAPTLYRFKQANKNHTIKLPKFYIAGCRILNININIVHTRLRHSSSSLNADLFRVHLANKHIKDYHYYVFCRTSLIFYYVYENGGVPTQFQNIEILCLQILATQ